jgi:putative ABC transport system permease protein
MIWLELILDTWNTIKAHKLRSVLSILGIIWGTYAISMLLAMGQGMYNVNAETLEKLGKPILWVMTGTTSEPYQGLSSGQLVQITPEAVMQLPKTFPQIQTITPFGSTTMTLAYGGKSMTTPMAPIDASYFSMTNFPVAGRVLTPLDVVQKQRVVLISHDVKQQLFGNTLNPLHKTIIINGVNFLVVGYVAEVNTGLSFAWGSSYMPYSTYAMLWQYPNAPFLVLLHHLEDLDTFKQQLTQYLAYHYHFAADDKQALNVIDFTSFAQVFSNILLATRIFLGFCGVMTLIVGGIGIANMMYLVIRERRHEIGLRMALGAEPFNILILFLLETVVLIALGGLLGSILVLLTLSALAHAQLPHWLGVPAMTLTSMVWIFLILLATALLSGYFPARQAALMVPVDALTKRD